MPARDRTHEHVRRALINDGWTITHDPLHLRWGKKDLYVDLGAERFLGAEKAGQKIAVEIKSFASPSLMDALEKALGQFVLYADILERVEPTRTLYLAVDASIHHEVFEDPVGELLLSKGRVKLLVFSMEAEVIEQWTPEPPTAT
ncbi:MAG: XisH family protein [Byssovorax sp.]